MKTIYKILTIAFLFVTIVASAQTIITEGKVSGNWSLEFSPYHIQGDIYVPENNLLSIEAGVQIVFQINSSLKISGQLLAIGNEVDSIIFTADSEEVGWAGIRWLNLGIFERDVFSKLEYCKFSYAKSKGRFPMNYGGAIGIMNTNNVIVSHCLFEHCAALNWGEAEAKGGAMALVNSDARVSHCTFQDNTSVFGGALVVVTGANPTIDNCLFVRNTALQFGGAVEVMELSSPAFVNCTFADNYAEFGGGAIDLFPNVQANIINCVLWNNQAGRVMDQVNIHSKSSAITFTYCNVEGGVDAIVLHPVTNKQIGNIDEVPDFMGFGEHPYMQATGSPCIDAGIIDNKYFPLYWDIPDEDLAGNSRIFNNAIDMGCYEYVFEQPLTPAHEKKEMHINASLEMLVYPCPASTTLSFQYKLAKDADVRLSIYDMQGRLVVDLIDNKQTEGFQKLAWDVQSLPKGTYIYKIKAGDQVNSGQILIAN